MTDREMAKLAVLVMAALAIAAIPRGADAGPGEAGGGHRPARTSGPTLARSDFVVLIWYLRNDPLGTFQYQSYDVRKGEYTGAVDDWIKLMREKHPSYQVRVHAVHLARERGATEQLKVGSVIHRELLLAAALSGVFVDAPVRISPAPYATQRSMSRSNIWTEMPGAGGASYVNPVRNTSPFPVPYPRPHP